VGADLRCDVILIAGFLGAGKTTLMRKILRWPGDLSKTAVLVNEFGQIGIDGELLQGFSIPVYELTNGCICCTIQGDLLRSIGEILDRFHPKRVLIEATGVADPYEVLGFLKSSQIEDRIMEPKVVTVLAGDLWEGREYFGPLFYNQIKAADLLLLNKVDLLPKEEVPRSLQEIREVNPSCSLVPTYHCEIDPGMLWEPVIRAAGYDAPSHLAQEQHEEHGNAEELGYVAFAFENQIPFKKDFFQRFVESMPVNLYRLKGFALVGDQRFFINHVGGKTEWVELAETGPTKLAFVGWEVQETEVLAALESCLEHATH
jgi:G3E family GTPase